MDGSNGRISCKSLSVILLWLWFHHFEKCFWKALRNRKNNRQFSLSGCTPDRYLTIEVEATKSSWNSFRTVQFFYHYKWLELNDRFQMIEHLKVFSFRNSRNHRSPSRPKSNQMKIQSQSQLQVKLSSPTPASLNLTSQKTAI